MNRGTVMVSRPQTNYIKLPRSTHPPNQLINSEFIPYLYALDFAARHV